MRRGSEVMLSWFWPHQQKRRSWNFLHPHSSLCHYCSSGVIFMKVCLLYPSVHVKPGNTTKLWVQALIENLIKFVNHDFECYVPFISDLPHGLDPPIILEMSLKSDPYCVYTLTSVTHMPPQLLIFLNRPFLSPTYITNWWYSLYLFTCSRWPAFLY